MKIIDRTVTEVIDTDMLAYSMYVLENRAIPSAIDGFKPTARKLVYAMTEQKPTGRIKVAELGGSLASYGYHHGEVSAMGACVKMATKYDNNVPVFEGHGAFGSRLVPEAAAPRYIFVSLSPDFKKYFIDEEVCDQSNSDDHPEPISYLPTIPWLLVNGASGIAVGFKCNVLPRSVDDLKAAVKACVKNETKFLNDDAIILPSFPSFKGTVKHIEGRKYTTTGIVSYEGKYTYKISELPIGYDRAAYVEHLHGMVEDGKIKSYEDACSKEGFCFYVKVGVTGREVIDKDPIKFFSLEKSQTEILTTLGIDGKLKIFETVNELIAYFVKYRISKVRAKIDYDIGKVKAQLEELKDKRKFIQHVVDKKLKLEGIKKADIQAYITSNITSNTYGTKFANLPLYALTVDAIEELDVSISKCEYELSELKEKDEIKTYLSYLK